MHRAVQCTSADCSAIVECRLQCAICSDADDADRRREALDARRGEARASVVLLLHSFTVIIHHRCRLRLWIPWLHACLWPLWCIPSVRRSLVTSLPVATCHLWIQVTSDRSSYPNLNSPLGYVAQQVAASQEPGALWTHLEHRAGGLASEVPVRPCRRRLDSAIRGSLGVPHVALPCMVCSSPAPDHAHA